MLGVSPLYDARIPNCDKDTNIDVRADLSRSVLLDVFESGFAENFIELRAVVKPGLLQYSIPLME